MSNYDYYDDDDDDDDDDDYDYDDHHRRSSNSSMILCCSCEYNTYYNITDGKCEYHDCKCEYYAYNDIEGYCEYHRCKHKSSGWCFEGYYNDDNDYYDPHENEYNWEIEIDHKMPRNTSDLSRTRNPHNLSIQQMRSYASKYPELKQALTNYQNLHDKKSFFDFMKKMKKAKKVADKAAKSKKSKNNKSNRPRYDRPKYNRPKN
jgi:hypothetical protein